MIYEYALVTDDNKALRSRKEMERLHPWITLHNTAILRISRSIHEQAHPVLYATNRFHYSVHYHVPTSQLFIDAPLFFMHLPKMRTVSLDFRNQYYARSDQVKQHEYAGELVSIYLEKISKQCAHLRHLSIHFMSPPLTVPLHSAAELHLPCKGAITAALLELKPRLESLTIVEYDDSGPMEEFCEGLAPKEEWVRGTSRSWGDDSLRADYADTFGDWEQLLGIGCSEVCVHRWSSIKSKE